MSRFASSADHALASEFRETINRLADQTREEQRRAAEEASKRSEPRALSPWILAGLVLIAAQSLLALSLYNQRYRQTTAPRYISTPILPENGCHHRVYQTYWKVVAYLRNHDHPPRKLDDLVGSYLDKLPVDPSTGKPLKYSTDGTRFDLRCTS